MEMSKIILSQRDMDFAYCKANNCVYPEQWDAPLIKQLRELGLEPMEALTGEWIGLQPIES